MTHITTVLGMLLFSAAPAVEFMGVQSDAGTVAFVCDGSRWTKKKIAGLAGELLKTVDAMSADQRFAVVFFADDRAFGPGGGAPLPASDENKRKLRDWLETIEFGDKSTPIPGLTRAFDANPDAVYFVSSGEFDDYDGVSAHVDSLNPGRKTRVHAIGYFETKKEDDSRSFVRFLKKLAEDNGGDLKLVYADELKKGR